MPKRKTLEEFKNDVYDLVGDEYTVLGNYINSQTKILIKHNKCGCEYLVRPSEFQQGHRCPKCSGLMKKNTNEFKNDIYDLVGDEYTVLGDYINNKTKILMKHNKCKCEYYVRPDMFLKSTRCPKCAIEINKNHRTKTDKQYKQEVFDLVGDEYSVLGDYINNRTKILMKHNKCGYEYYVTPKDFLNNNNRCPKCSEKMKKNTKQYKQEVYDLVGDEYTVLGDYINNKTKILVKHNKCGYEYLIEPKRFLRGDRCPKCSGLMKKTNEQFKKEVYDLVGDEYTVLGDYINNRTKILMKHNKCGYEYYVTPDKFLFGRRCPKCKESRGEKIISKFLEDNGIEYNTQITFPECKYKKNLKFDFQIFIKGSSKIILLEYDGIQHFDINSQFNMNEDDFELNQLRDNIKNKYCKQQGIHLYRISYKDFNNIEDILNKIIEKESSTTIESK